MVRVFISVELGEETKQEIKDIQKQIEDSNLLFGKMSEPESIHLTLKFLGEIEEKKLEEVKKLLKEIKFKKFEAKLGKFGLFSDRILWIQLDGEEIMGLQKEVDEKLKELFKPEPRFMAHITIARVKNIRVKTKLLDFLKRIKMNNKISVEEFFLKKSTLTPQGAVYETLEKYELR